MATYSKRVLQNGHINYAIQAKVKDKETGKSKFECTTWKNPDNLNGVKAEKAAIVYGEAWEENLRGCGVKMKNLQEASFEEIANEWLETRKYNMADSYYLRAVEAITRMSKFFGDERFVNIKAREVQKFFNYLNAYEYVDAKAVIKESEKSKLNNLVCQMGVRKISDEGLFTRPSLYYARLGKKIEINTAKAICDRLGLKLYDVFDKVETKSQYKKESIMKYKRVLSCIFNYAISIELVSKNYASSSYLKNVIGGEKSKDIEILDDNEFNKLIDVLAKHKIYDTIAIYLEAYLGIRNCEACGLEWKDIDFEKHEININRNRLYIQRKGIICKELKTKYSRRTLFIVDSLFNKLLEHKKWWDKLRKNDKDFDNCDAIFCNPDGSPCFPQKAGRLLKKYLVEAGVKTVSPHKLRHTWITKLIASGVPINVVSKMAGHADCEITLKIYTHYCKDADNSREALRAIFDKHKTLKTKIKNTKKTKAKAKIA